MDRHHRRAPGGVSVGGPAPESPLAALEQLSAEVGVPLDDLRRTVEEALAAAYKRAFEPEGEVLVHLSPETGEMDVLLRGTAPEGGLVERHLPVDEFKRLAAQTARSAVMRHLRDLERDRALSELARRHGALANGSGATGPSPASSAARCRSTWARRRAGCRRTSRSRASSCSRAGPSRSWSSS